MVHVMYSNKNLGYILGKSMLFVVGNIRMTDMQIYQYITLYALIQIQNIGINITCNNVIYQCPHVSIVRD